MQYSNLKIITKQVDLSSKDPQLIEELDNPMTVIFARLIVNDDGGAKVKPNFNIGTNPELNNVVSSGERSTFTNGNMYNLPLVSGSVPQVEGRIALQCTIPSDAKKHLATIEIYGV